MGTCESRYKTTIKAIQPATVEGTKERPINQNNQNFLMIMKREQCPDQKIFKSLKSAGSNPLEERCSPEGNDNQDGPSISRLKLKESVPSFFKMEQTVYRGEINEEQLPDKGNEAGRGLGAERFHHDALELKNLVLDGINTQGLNDTDKQCQLQSPKSPTLKLMDKHYQEKAKAERKNLKQTNLFLKP